MAQEPARCDACGRELDERPFDPYQIPVSVNPNPDEPKNFVERSLKQHNETLDKAVRAVGRTTGTGAGRRGR